jgi:geranylgeranyl reductase family protein
MEVNLQRPRIVEPERDRTDRVWDVAVVGAGPAGATAALHLAGRGHRVVLLDRRPFPRDKTCGDALLPDAVRCLRRAGVWRQVEARAFHGTAARFVSPSRVEVVIAGDFYTMHREALDAVLVREAVQRGAVLRRCKVERLEAPPDRNVELCTSGTRDRLSARVAIIATGAEVSLLRPLGMVRGEEPSAFAGRRYLRSPVPLDELIFSFERASLPGYGWIFPLGGDIYNVGVGLFGGKRQTGLNLRGLFDAFMRESPLAREMAAHGEFLTPLRGARLRCGLSGVEPVIGAVLAVGETVGTTFPFSGEGIGKAMESGELAAEAVDAALREQDRPRLNGYLHSLEQHRPLFRGYEIAEAWLSRAWLADFLARRARRSRYIRQALSDVVAETADPRAVFSVRGVLRSLWS